MILVGIDCTEQYEAMKRGEWPEPHPEVVAAHLALDVSIDVTSQEGEEGNESERGDG